MENMFCRQCEQTLGGNACVTKGICGKDDRTSALQDLLIHGLKGIGFYGHKARELGVKDEGADLFIFEALFTTVTNVNFDEEDIASLVRRSHEVQTLIRTAFLEAYESENGRKYDGKIPEGLDWDPDSTTDGLVEQGKRTGLLSDNRVDEDIRSLREVLLYGLKGMAAYADHAAILGEKDETVDSCFYKCLSAICDDSLSAGDLIELINEFGHANLRCMEILDKAHTDSFGHPEPTEVSLVLKKGPCILISGHDLPDLEKLLKQTEGKGVNIYTHGEMLPAHGYPGLKKYAHLAGHYGGAWQDQLKEFGEFPGTILMTTNCIQKPGGVYKDRIFTTGLVRWPGVKHVSGSLKDKDFSAVIEQALDIGGNAEDTEGGKITVGFGHNAVLGVADEVISAVKEGKIKHFFLVGGCDGAKPGRNYYTKVAEKIPQDCVILTLACGKFRFNKMELGTIGELPRLIDVGQCNDAYSAVKIVSALADAFECSVNDLPLSFILSWYEQKAVCILLSLFSLGIKGIKLGPSLPAFISENVLKVLVDNFDIKPISQPEADIQDCLGAEVAA